MNDLIKRSEVLKVLEECNLDKRLFEKDVFDRINAIPIAYDIDNVVAELNGMVEETANGGTKISTGDTKFFKYCTTVGAEKCEPIDCRKCFNNRAIEIVRKGGVE